LPPLWEQRRRELITQRAALGRNPPKCPGCGKTGDPEIDEIDGQVWALNELIKRARSAAAT
jgi:hypothetical protein